jgi:chromosome condensin MukBEF complex kleisin-like MukF subunit
MHTLNNFHLKTMILNRLKYSIIEIFIYLEQRFIDMNSMNKHVKTCIGHISIYNNKHFYNKCSDDDKNQQKLLIMQ